MLPGLQDPKCRSLGIGEERHPAGVHDVEGLHHDASAGLVDLGRGLVGAVDPDVGVPHGR